MQLLIFRVLYFKLGFSPSYSNNLGWKYRFNADCRLLWSLVSPCWGCSFGCIVCNDNCTAVAVDKNGNLCPGDMIFLFCASGIIFGIFLGKAGISFPEDTIFIILLDIPFFCIEVAIIEKNKKKFPSLERLNLNGETFGYFSAGLAIAMAMLRNESIEKITGFRVEYPLVEIFCFLLAVAIIFAVIMEIRKGKIFLDENGFDYSAMNSMMRVNFSDIKEFSIKRDIFGRKIVLSGIFSGCIKKIGSNDYQLQRWRIIEVRVSKNFDLTELFERIKKSTKATDAENDGA